MTLRLHVDIDRVTLDQLIQLEQASKLAEVRDALAMFVVDENKNPIEYGAAKELVGKLTIREMRSATDMLLSEMKKANENAVPPVNGDV